MSGSEVLQVLPDELRSACAGYDTLGDTLESALSTLQGALSSAGSCWGGDEPGQTFAGGYTPNADAASDAFGQVAQALHGIRATLDAAAAQFEATQQSLTDALNGGHS